MKTSGFTLIELSIVLVIIGLIVGGVLVGQDLIRAAQLRAQVSQIEKYKTAVNVFKLKYNYLPGDIPDPLASQLGFGARQAAPGKGNGDGLLEGINGAGGAHGGSYLSGGEVLTFWADLGAAGLIEQQLTEASSALYVQAVNPVNATTTPSLDDIFPQAELPYAYLYVWSFTAPSGYSGSGTRGGNYIGLAGISQLSIGGSLMPSYISAADAWAIDKKADDGQPYSGSVQSLETRGYVTYLRNSWVMTTTLSAGAGNCVNNGGVVGNSIVYSTAYAGGSQMQCALGFYLN